MSNLKIRIHSIQECSIGYGQRLGIWLQGCNLACPGCSSQDTWAVESENEMPWPMLAATLEFMLSMRSFDGVTISGGEPFQQKEALKVLLKAVRAIQNNLAADWDIILYSGYNYNEIADNKDILSEIDLLVAGRYNMNLPKSDLRGSSNQTLHWFTNRAKDRYSVVWLADTANTKTINLSRINDSIVWTGLPEQGDLEKLEELLKSQGIVWKEVSWHR